MIPLHVTKSKLHQSSIFISAYLITVPATISPFFEGFKKGMACSSTGLTIDNCKNHL